ncbi:MAG: hypothetical protein E7149_06600 [Rikenellaceae bacterium]|nr:hypothetical protein [Rikenellaceae bacterium]
MKRLFLLLVALFVVETLQAQVMCYEYEYSYTQHWTGSKKNPSKVWREFRPDLKGDKMHWVISKKDTVFYAAMSDGGYCAQDKIKVRRYRLGGSYYYDLRYNNRIYDVLEDYKTIERGVHHYHLKRVFKAYDNTKHIYESAPHLPKFKSDSSRYKNFREWFMQEMPAQDSIRSVQSITIVIEKDGSVTVENVTTGTPQNEQLARQVTEVLTRSPKWTPAYDKYGKTPLRFRIKGRDLLLRRTIEGRKRDREKVVNRMNTLCERWGVDAGRVCCQISYTDIGGITLEQLGERMNTATRPVVVVAVEETCQPSLNLMEDWNMILKGYEGKYDLYLVLGLHGSNTALREYSKAFRTAESNPSILFVYNKYGMSEERVGYSRETGVELISWFDRMMKKSAF